MTFCSVFLLTIANLVFTNTSATDQELTQRQRIIQESDAFLDIVSSLSAEDLRVIDREFAEDRQSGDSENQALSDPSWLIAAVIDFLTGNYTPFKHQVLPPLERQPKCYSHVSFNPSNPFEEYTVCGPNCKLDCLYLRTKRAHPNFAKKE